MKKERTVHVHTISPNPYQPMFHTIVKFPFLCMILIFAIFFANVEPHKFYCSQNSFFLEMYEDLSENIMKFESRKNAKKPGNL